MSAPIRAYWDETHTPAVNTAATASKAAGGAGVRHVCTSILAVFAAGTTAPAVAMKTLQLRDGATGAGTVVWSATVGVEATAGRNTVIQLSGLNIVGSSNTAMTLEFDAAGGANTFQSVAIHGYDA